jgi:hypothetical protein
MRLCTPLPITCLKSEEVLKQTEGLNRQELLENKCQLLDPCTEVKPLAKTLWEECVAPEWHASPRPKLLSEVAVLAAAKLRLLCSARRSLFWNINARARINYLKTLWPAQLLESAALQVLSTLTSSPSWRNVSSSSEPALPSLTRRLSDWLKRLKWLKSKLKKTTSLYTLSLLTLGDVILN